MKPACGRARTLSMITLMVLIAVLGRALMVALLTGVALLQLADHHLAGRWSPDAGLSTARQILHHHAPSPDRAAAETQAPTVLPVVSLEATSALWSIAGAPAGFRLVLGAGTRRAGALGGRPPQLLRSPPVPPPIHPS